MIKYWLYKPY